MDEDAEHSIVHTPVWVFDNFGEVTAVKVFPDGRRMAVTSSDGILRVWDLKNGVVLRELEMRGGEMRDMALSQDGKLIVGCTGGYVSAWDGDTGKRLIHAFSPHEKSALTALDISPDGATLATAGLMDGIRLWSTATWQPQGEPIRVDCRGPVCNLRYSPSGGLLSFTTNSNIQIWNPVTREHITTIDRGSGSLAWTPDGTRFLSVLYNIIQEWDTSTWTKVGDTIWRGPDLFCDIAMNCDGTVVAFPTTGNRLRLWHLLDRRTIAIFQHSKFPRHITFSVDGKHIFAGCSKDNKVSVWAVPEHAWPEDTAKDQATDQDCYAEARDSDSETQDSESKFHDSESKILVMNTAVRNACISGDLATAEDLLTRETHASGDNYWSYANRSIVLARRLDWDHALDDATKSLGIKSSLMGNISMGIALCGKKQVRDAKRAFDLSFTFAEGDSKTNHYIYMIKAIALFNANQPAEAIRRIRELAFSCPDADTTLACRIMEVYLHIQLGNNALDRARPTEAADHFTTAVNTGTFLSNSVIDSKYEDFVVLFGCDFNSLWQTANQKRCHALLRAGKLAEVFEAYRYMVDTSDEATSANHLNWFIGFMQELSTFRDTLNADATPDIHKYDDENDSISDIDSDIDRIDDVAF